MDVNENTFLFLLVCYGCSYFNNIAKWGYKTCFPGTFPPFGGTIIEEDKKKYPQGNLNNDSLF